MHKHSSFAIAAAIMTGLAVGFWIISVRSKVTEPTTHVIHVKPNPLSVEELEPAY
jgi:hypothetical protein